MVGNKMKEKIQSILKKIKDLNVLQGIKNFKISKEKIESLIEEFKEEIPQKEYILEKIRSEAKLFISEKRYKNKRFIQRAILVIVVAILIFLPSIISRDNRSEQSVAKIKNINAEIGSIEKTISGTGTLSAIEVYDLLIPDGVEITSFCVSNGQNVKEGDPLAYVDLTSVIECISSIKDSMLEIESEMTDVIGSSEQDYIYTKFTGTLNHVYAKAGDNVEDVMNEYGCLATVVSDETGDEISIVGITGTISNVLYGEGSHVSYLNTVFILSDVVYNYEYQQLNQKHQQYEEMTNNLFQMYEDGYIKSPCDGFVSDIDEELYKKTKTILATSASYSMPVTITSITVNQSDPTKSDYSYKFYGSSSASDGTITIVTDSNIAVNGNYYLDFDDNGTPTGFAGQFNATTPTPTPSPSTPVNNNNNTNGAWATGSGAGAGFSVSGNSYTTTETVELFSLDQTVVLTVTPQDKMKVSIVLDEQDILDVSVGQKAEITIDALPGRTYSGEVTEINIVGSNSGGNSKYSAEVEVSCDEDMLPGMNASILITYQTVEDVVTIPVEALDDKNGKSYVYSSYSRKNKTLKRPIEVETGASDGISVEIKSGISDGDKIFYYYYETSNGNK